VKLITHLSRLRICLYCVHKNNFNKCFMKTAKHEAPNYMIFSFLRSCNSIPFAVIRAVCLLKTRGGDVCQTVNTTVAS
jgi:hypothetical protein